MSKQKELRDKLQAAILATNAPPPFAEMPKPELKPQVKREQMQLFEAIRHILQCCEASKAYLHWQVTARAVLVSLLLDGRISKEIRDEISREIVDLYKYDYLLRPVQPK